MKQLYKTCLRKSFSNICTGDQNRPLNLNVETSYIIHTAAMLHKYFLNV